MFKGIFAVFMMVVGLCFTSNTDARSMDDNFVLVQQCADAYVVVDGVSYFSGRYCTNFAVYDGGVAEPRGNDRQYWDAAYGGGAFRYVGVKSIPDDPNNNEPSTCASDEFTRWLHATKDVLAYNAMLPPDSKLQSGQMVRVTYDGGGSEVWTVVLPNTSSPLSQTPKGGSLKCPTQGA